jgi:glycerol kinase
MYIYIYIGLHVKYRYSCQNLNKFNSSRHIFKKYSNITLRENSLTGVGRDSSVGIATGYGMDVPGIESRRGASFFAHVQTGPGAHLASCTMGTGSFAGVKSGRGVTLTPHLLLVPLVMKD